MSMFDEAVRHEISRPSVGERYEAVARSLDSIRDDASALSERLGIDAEGRHDEVWTKVTEGGVEARFERIRSVFGAVHRETLAETAEREAGIARRRLVAASRAVEAAREAEPGAFQLLESDRDQRLRLLQNRDRRLRIARGVSEHLSVAYAAAEMVMGRVQQTTECKERVDSRSIAFFGHGGIVLAALSAACTGPGELPRALLRESVCAFVDAVLAFQEGTLAIVAEMRALYDGNEQELREAIQSTHRRLAHLVRSARSLAAERAEASGGAGFERECRSTTEYLDGEGAVGR